MVIDGVTVAMGNENGEKRVESRETVLMRIYEETKLDAEPSLNNR